MKLKQCFRARDISFPGTETGSLRSSPEQATNIAVESDREDHCEPSSTEAKTCSP